MNYIREVEISEKGQSGSIPVCRFFSYPVPYEIKLTLCLVAAGSVASGLMKYTFIFLRFFMD